jgi:hypothetical protein
VQAVCPPPARTCSPRRTHPTSSVTRIALQPKVHKGLQAARCASVSHHCDPARPPLRDGWHGDRYECCWRSNGIGLPLVTSRQRRRSYAQAQSNSLGRGTGIGYGCGRRSRRYN